MQLPGGPAVNALGFTFGCALGYEQSLLRSDADQPPTLNGQVYTSTYDGTIRLVTEISPEGRARTAWLDEQNRVVHFKTPGQAPIKLLYNALGGVSVIDTSTSSGQRRTQVTYDALGRIAAVVDPLDRTNAWAYDEAGRVQSSPWPTDKW